MPVKLNPTSQIKARLGIEPSGKVQRYFTKRCADYMDKYVPYNQGDLRGTIDIQPDYIEYEMPYARYQYYGKKMVMSNGKSAFYSDDYGFWSKKGEKKMLTEEDLVYHTQGTGPYWDRRMVSAEINDLVEEVENYIRRQ